MTYRPDIPQANDIISQSQPQILSNFNLLNQYFDINHVNYTDATTADRGKHRESTYILNGSPTATAATDLNVYNDVLTAGGSPGAADTYQLHFQQVNVGQTGILTPFAYAIGTSPAGTGPTPFTLIKSFNVSQMLKTSASTFDVEFTNNANDTDYLVFVTMFNNNVRYGVSSTATDKFTVSGSGQIGTNKFCVWVVALP